MTAHTKARWARFFYLFMATLSFFFFWAVFLIHNFFSYPFSLVFIFYFLTLFSAQRFYFAGLLGGYLGGGK